MIKYYTDLLQRTDEWYAARCGILTASEMKHIITAKKLEYSESEKEKTHLYELGSQRVTKYVEPVFQSFDMLRGQDDESYARETYHETYAPIETCGFVTNDKWGFTIGWSPDGLQGEDGCIETKSRMQKYQFQTIIESRMPDDFLIQVQTGLLVSERKWCDFISYCGGMHMDVIRVEADDRVQNAIIAAAKKFHEKLDQQVAIYQERLADPKQRLIMTERREREITV